MSTGIPETPRSASSCKVTDVTCLGCGCLCDDLAVTLDGGRVIEMESACPIGRDWFVAAASEAPNHAAIVEGHPVDPSDAIERVIAILNEAQAPVIWGLTRTSTETVRSTLELADTIRARIILDRSRLELGRVAAFQEQGRVSATLGEVKNRADLVVFWGVDPLKTHPRHWERYSVEPVGRFVPEGRAGRSVIVVDSESTESARNADAFYRVPADEQLEALLVLRSLIRGSRLGQSSDRMDRSVLEELADRMKAARYGALFFQATTGSSLAWEQAARLVRDLNDVTRFVMLGMGRAGNLVGAEAALTWQGGYLQGVDYRAGRPTPLNEATTLDDVLRRRETDAVVSIADGWPERLSVEASEFLSEIPTILIGPPSSLTQSPTVAIATAKTGFDAGGTVMRSDGVSLPLRPVRAPSLPLDRDVIRRVIAGLQGRTSS